jgi:hypothetical protein
MITDTPIMFTFETPHTERDQREIVKLVQRLVTAERELAEAKKQWRMSSVCRELTAERDQLRARVAELALLLKAARCPDDNCDGNGSSWYATTDHATGEPEQVQCPCQWCHERSQAIDQARTP